MLAIKILALWINIQSGTSEINLRGKGASFPNALYKNWIPAYKKHRSQHIDLNMDYDSIGSGAGKSAIMANIDIEYAGSDSLLSEADQATYPDLITFPTMAGSVVLAYNLPGVTSLNISREVAVGIYNGTIEWWNSSLIQDINPSVSLPHERVTVIARADKSGTTTLFTEGLSSFSSAWESTYGIFSTTNGWKTGVITYFGETSSGVAGILMSFPYSIGYLSAAAALETNLHVADIENSQGNFIKTSPENVQQSMDYNALLSSNLTFSLHNAGGSISYPLAGFTYFIVYRTTFTNCRSMKEFVRYVYWFMTDQAQRDVCSTYGMASLSSTLVSRVKEHALKTMKCNGQILWDLVQQDILRENEDTTTKTWITGISVAIPLISLIIIGFLVYIIYQRMSFIKRLYNDDWYIPIDDILFFYDKRVSNSLKSKSIFGKSVFSFQSLNAQECPELVAHIIQWPGKYNGSVVGLRLTTVKQFKKVNNAMKAKMLMMQDKISHINITRFYGLSELDQDHYVISDYCAKGQLRDLLQNAKFNLTREVKISLALDVAQGMYYLHSKNIIHGNLSSSVCLIDSKWTIKICDWEFYSLMVSKNDQVQFYQEIRKCDTEDQTEYAKSYRDFWTAPEVLRLEHNTSPTFVCDVFSYSIILQEIFTREDPYAELVDEMTPTDVINTIIQHGRLRPKPSDDMPLLIRQCMEISWSDDPIDRPSFEQIIKMIRRSNASVGVKSVLDSMMESVEEYTVILEEKLEEKTTETNFAIDHLKCLLQTYIPKQVVCDLSEGQSVTTSPTGNVGIIVIDIVHFNHQVAGIKKMRYKIKIIEQFHKNLKMIAEQFSAFLYAITFESVVFIIGLHWPESAESIIANETAKMCIALDTNFRSAMKPKGFKYSIAASFGELQETMLNDSGRYHLLGSCLEQLFVATKETKHYSILIAEPLYGLVKSCEHFKVSRSPKYQENEHSYYALSKNNPSIPEHPEDEETVVPLDESADSGIEINKADAAVAISAQPIINNESQNRAQPIRNELVVVECD